MHVADIGTEIQMDVGVDITGATVITYRFDPPTGASFNRTGALVTTGADGLVTYTTILGDITISGVWRVQVYVETPDGKWSSDVEIFVVDENIIVP